MATKRKAREGSAGQYSKADLIKRSLKLINELELTFVDDLASFLPCSRSTFYNHGLHKLDAIKEALYDQKARDKYEMRKNWKESENATLQIGAYKLLANDDELERLNNSKQKTEVIIKDDRTEAEILRNIKGLENTANDEDYDITKD